MDSLEESGECFIDKKDSIDYRAEMNGVYFESWWNERVLPNLSGKSIVVMPRSFKAN